MSGYGTASFPTVPYSAPGKRRSAQRSRSRSATPSRTLSPYNRLNLGLYTTAVQRGVFHQVKEVTFSAGTPVYAFGFALQDFQGYTNIVAGFDMFRIDMIEVKVLGQANAYLYQTQGAVATNPVSGPLYIPYLLHAVDVSDSTTTPTINQLLEYNTLRMSPLDKMIIRRWRPCLTPVGQVTTSQATIIPTRANSWLSNDNGFNQSVNWNGIKMGVQGDFGGVGNIPNTYHITMFIRIYVSMKNRN